MLLNPYRFEAAVVPFVADAAVFDGSNDYIRKAADLTGTVDGQMGIGSLWLRLDGGDALDQYIVHGSTILANAGNSAVRFTRLATTKKFNWALRNAANAVIMDIITAATFSPSATWYHVLASWNLATAGQRHLYVNDVSDLVQTTFTVGSTINYTVADWAIGSVCSGQFKTFGSLAEVYFAIGQYLDFSVVANRRKFISDTFKPVFLGTDGSLPTGVAPIIYHHLDDGETPDNFAINRGTGGNFTVNGALTTASTSPSD